MKNSINFRLRVLLACLFLAPLAQAQTAPAARPGYWNIETNLTTRAYTIVRFYNGQDRLVYEENLPNICLDFSRRKGLCRRTTRQLSAALQQVLRDSSARTQPATLLAQELGQGHRVPRVYAAR